MPKTVKDKPNRSQAVREYLAAHPTADTKTIVDALAAQGVKASSTLVYYVKSKQGQAKRKAKRAAVAEHSRKTAAANPLEVVIRVKDLAQEVGGMKNLKQFVDLLAD